MVAGSAWSQWRTQRTGFQLSQGDAFMGTTASTRRRRIVTITTGALAVSVASVAFAAWVADGTGSGTATSRTHQEVSINGAADVTDLYPGDVQDLSVVIDNSGNPYNVVVQTITVGTSSAPCTEPDFTFGAYTIPAGDLVVPAGSDATVVLTDAVAMGHDSATDCQGDTWTLDLSFEGESTGLPAANDGPFAADVTP